MDGAGSEGEEMIDESECCECGAVTVDDGCWRPGQWCLFGMLFACSLKCCEAYATKHAREGWRPGEPNFDAVEPGRVKVEQ